MAAALRKNAEREPLENPMPFLNVQDTNFVLYPIHLLVACETDSSDRAGQRQTLALRSRILRFSVDQNRPRVGQRSGGNSHGPRPGMTGPTSTLRGLAPSSEPRVWKPRFASRQRSAILGARSKRLEFEPPHASSLDATETRGRVRPRTMACRYRARISREGNSVL
jgi:hypothetical protein